VLVDFWFNHFNVSFYFGGTRFAVTSYERDSIRPYVFGSFKDLVMATAKSSAMMQYLSNYRSEKGHIIENYAREIMELHTLGIDAGYTQKDIEEGARIFTGWGVELGPKTGKFIFYPEGHDTGAKRFIQTEFPAGEGMAEGERAIDILSKNPNTAKHISKKLAMRFISDTPSDEVVSEIAQVFSKSNGNLRDVYRFIFNSKEFWNEKNYKAKLKSPFEFVASAARSLGMKVQLEKSGIKEISQFLEKSGQPLYQCPQPTGFDENSTVWVSPNGALNRIKFANNLMRKKIENLTEPKLSVIKRTTSGDRLNYFNGTVFNSVLTKETLKKVKDVSYSDPRQELAAMFASMEYQRK